MSITISINVDKAKVLITDDVLKENKILFDYEIIIGLYLFNKIKALNLKIDREKMKKLNIKERIKTEQIEKLKKQMPDKKELKEMLNKLNIKCTKFELNTEIYTPNVMITTGIVTILSTIISILLCKIVKEKNATQYKYKITPVYTSKNMLKVDFKSIINVKMVHIIYIIYIFIKKRRVDKNERTSNRRTYDYSYE